MKTISIYPVIRLDIEVPDDFDDVLENVTNLKADFNETTFDIEGCKIGECELCGWKDEDLLI